MYGRYTQSMFWREMVEFYRVHNDAETARNIPVRHSVVPTQDLPICRLSDNRCEPVQIRWALEGKLAGQIEQIDRAIENANKAIQRFCSLACRTG